MLFQHAVANGECPGPHRTMVGRLRTPISHELGQFVFMQSCGGNAQRRTSVESCDWMLVLQWQFVNSTWGWKAT